MECPTCGRSVESGDRFCNGCGTSLEGVTDTTQIVAIVDDVDEGGTTADVDADTPPAGLPPVIVDASDDVDLAPTELVTIDTGDDELVDEPAWAATGSLPVTTPDEAATVTGDLPATEPITEVWMEQVADEPAATTPYDFTEREPVAITGEIESQVDATATMPVVPAAAPAPPPRFGFNLILLISLATGIVALVALFGNILTITSDTRLVQTDDTPAGFRTGTWILDDLADNLSIAGLIAVVAMVAGGVASGFRWRWGSGLAGGAGLAMAGLAAVAVGLAQFPIDTAHAFARVPADDPFVLTITRDLGYWLLLAVGALGIVLFFASVNDAFGDRRAGLNPWIAALGALAIVVAAAGPLLPENQAIFSDNWYLIEGVGEASALLLVGRLVQLGLFVIGGVVGFLSVRRWGLGLAVGASLPGLWLVISTLLDVGDRPVGLGFRNPGAVDMHVHGVTIIGTSAVIAMIVLALIGAYDQGVRERR
ncbi:MAG: zinc ribbon domain-containing protein [Ilumatobacteraceae bacterium]|nr:zinc ribbon domain-containing protein [Ilumatobacteraceae bacterium]